MKSFPSDMPAFQQRALAAEIERQKTLSNGWHACFDFTWTGTGYRKQWYVTWRWAGKMRDDQRRNFSSKTAAINKAAEQQEFCKALASLSSSK